MGNGKPRAAVLGHWRGKLPLLFLATILLPGVVLGVFGMRALQADKYRLEHLLQFVCPLLVHLRPNPKSRWARAFKLVGWAW